MSASRFASSFAHAIVLASITLIVHPTDASAQYGVSVMPDGATTGDRTANTSGYTATFTVWNTGSVDDTYLVTCYTSGPVTCTGIGQPGASQTDLFVAAGEMEQIVAYYNVGAAGTGTLSGMASSYGAGLGSVEDFGSFTVPVVQPPPPVPAPIVTPDAAPRPIVSGTGLTLAFLVKNPGSGARTYTFAVTCTGVVTSCSPPSPSQLNVGAGQTVTVWPTFSVSGATFATGQLNLTATDQPAAKSDAGSYAITVAPSGPVVERSLCLTIAIGPGAAYECGDLRLVHALPALRTLNTPRVPTLVYNSQHAHPHPIVSLDVTLPAADPLPTTVEATLVVNGQQHVRGWPGTAWASPGQTRRVMVAFDGGTLATGLYPYTLEIRRITPTGNTVLQTAAGTLPIVSRAASPFGPGWWLAGWERLHFTLPSGQVLWVGGGGSVRRYERAGVIGTDTAYLATPVDRPDTLLHTNANRWIRRLGGGGQVEFNAAGIHDTTRNRLGYTTAFQDSSGFLKTIDVSPAGTGLRYTFVYAGSPARLTSVAAPDTVVGTVRTTSLVWIADSVRITDPGSLPVTFAYEAGGTNRIKSRGDRRGAVTSFAYDTAFRLRASGRFPGGGAPAITPLFCDAAVRGLAPCSPALVPPDSSYTIFDGPRTDSADVTHFWVDRFGSPWKIRDPYGYITTLARTDASWPALATRVQYPNGRTMGAAYDARGNLAVSIDSNLYTPGQHATTRYQWDQRWDAVTENVAPTGEVTRFGYDATNGNRLWQEDGRGTASRVTFAYYPPGSCAGLLKTVTDPLSAKDSVAYDSRCNLAYARTPMGYVTTTISDRLGRPRIVRTPVGSVQRDDSTFYDARGLPWRTVAFGPAVAGVSGAQKVVVRNFYDQEGQLDSLQRWAEPDSADIDTLTTRWRHDNVGRVVAEVAPDLKRDSTAYDAAGNPTAVVTRRGDTLTMSYDRMNRVRRRIVPAETYFGRFQGIATYLTNRSDFHPYPWLPTSAPSECTMNNQCYPDSTQWTLTLPGDTAQFSYGPMGELLTADNADAKVKRTYFKDGRVQTDTLRVRTWNGVDFDQHRYGLTYNYDLSGRLISLRHPHQLAPRNPGVLDLETYAYDPVTGLLSTVTDPLGNEFAFSYNMRNDRIRLDRPGGVVERFTHDSAGRLIADTIVKGSDVFRRATLEYSDAQRVSVARNSVPPQDTVRSLYSGLGHLMNLMYELPAYTETPIPDTAHVYSLNLFRLDPLGNVTFAKDSNNLDAPFSQSIQTVERNHVYQAGTGRLVYTAQPERVDTSLYDAAGNFVYSGKVPWNNPPTGATLEDHANFYGADNRLRVAETRTLKLTGQSETSPWTMTLEHYRYDALGRRVLVRTWRTCQDGHELSSCTWSSIRRIVWDGAAELYEIQAYAGLIGFDLDPTVTWDPPAAELENDTLPVYKTQMTVTALDHDASLNYGRVAYTHGPGLDEPLSAIRLQFTRAVYDNHDQGWHQRTWGPVAVAPHWNWRGHPEIGALASGALSDCYVTSFGEWCAEVPWRIRPFAFTQRPADTLTGWWGGWLRDKEDGTGTLFRRNRYVDPATGRFTQEDPIGFAGGLNLYGFANGDPVNFSDPFGLGPCKGLGLWAAIKCFLAYEWRGFQAGSDPTRLDFNFDEEGQAGALLGRLSLAFGGAGRVTVGAPRAVAPAAAGPVSASTRLSMQLASAEGLAAAQAGRGIAIAGAGAASGRQIDDIARLVETYGGEAADWAKMSTGRTVNGVRVEVHWYENVRTSQRVEFKTPYGH